MLIDLPLARLELGKREHLMLSGAGRTRLTVVSGTAWITLERGAGDTIVTAGESFVIPSDRPVVVGPLRSSLLLEVRSRNPGRRLS